MGRSCAARGCSTLRGKDSRLVADLIGTGVPHCVFNTKTWDGSPEHALPNLDSETL